MQHRGGFSPQIKVLPSPSHDSPPPVTQKVIPEDWGSLANTGVAVQVAEVGEKKWQKLHACLGCSLRGKGENLCCVDFQARMHWNCTLSPLKIPMQNSLKSYREKSQAI